MTADLDAREFTLDDVLRHAVDGMFVIGRNRQVVLFSEGCERITGVEVAAVVGTSDTCQGLMDCRDEHDRPLSGPLCAALAVLTGEVPSARRRMSLRRRDGRRVWVETTYSPMCSEGDEVTHVVGIMRDMTEVKHHEDELRRAASRGAAYTHDETRTSSDNSNRGWMESRPAPPTEGTDNMGPLDQILTTIERREILAALRRANGQRTLAARLLGISRSRLYRRMEALGIDPREIGEAQEAPPREDV